MKKLYMYIQRCLRMKMRLPETSKLVPIAWRKNVVKGGGKEWGKERGQEEGGKHRERECLPSNLAARFSSSIFCFSSLVSKAFLLGTQQRYNPIYHSEIYEKQNYVDYKTWRKNLKILRIIGLIAFHSFSSLCGK